MHCLIIFYVENPEKFGLFFGFNPPNNLAFDETELFREVYEECEVYEDLREFRLFALVQAAPTGLSLWRI